MNDKLENLLYERYPLIFAERTLPVTQTCMSWGICCGDGWFNLIDQLCERLQSWTNLKRSEQVVAVQVKEKWGGLRFYLRGGSAEQRGMISMAEAMSTRICEQCGKPGQKLVYSHCHITRCVEHSPQGALIEATYLELYAR